MTLKELRMSRNLTQKDVADAVGMTVQRYSEYELSWRPISNVKLINAVGIARVLGITAEQLLSLEPYERKSRTG